MTRNHGPSVKVLLHRILAEQGRQAEQIASIVRALDRGRGTRDAADVALLLAVTEAVGGRTCTTSEIVAHADVCPPLAAALRDADIDDAQQLGCVFRRVEGVSTAGLRLLNTGAKRGGAVVWRIEVCEG